MRWRPEPRDCKTRSRYEQDAPGDIPLSSAAMIVPAGATMHTSKISLYLRKKMLRREIVKV